MKTYFKPLIEEVLSTSVDNIAGEFDVSVGETFFIDNQHGANLKDNW